MSMTDEQIEQNAEKYADQFVSRCFCGEWNEVILRFTAGAHSRDNEVNDLLSQLEDKDGYIAYLRKELDKLLNPWISVKERLPEIEDEKEECTGEVFVCIKDGVYLVAHYSYFYKAWYAFDDRGGCMYRKIRTPRYWMPIPESNRE